MEVRSKLSRVNNDKEVLVTAKSERVEMTLNTDSAISSGLLIQRLTELYENPIEASVRETVSNALDAVTVNHSGERPEVRISSPSNMTPILVIKDNGVGMSYDDLKEIYSKYGASTKAEDLNQIGAYGLGAKSPLAYGTEFTVTSIKNGVKTTIIVAREELTNYIKIVASEKTSEKSGTAVSIPVNNYDINKFSEYIDLYKKYPIDKDIDLYIDSKNVKDSEYKLISTDAVIFKGDNENVVGRMWVKPSHIANLLLKLDRSSIKKSLKFIIGGWVYDSPTTRNSYRYSDDSDIIIQLKAGIVGFNSSRDSILENDRSEKLEDTVIDYIMSSDFTDKLIKFVNDFELSDFKEILMSLYSTYKEQVQIKDGKIIFNNNVNSYSYSRYKKRVFDFDLLVHNETGFDLNSLVRNVPKNKKPTLVITNRKMPFRKTQIVSTLSSDMSNSNSSREGQSISEINDLIENLPEGNELTLGDTLYKLTIEVTNKTLSKHNGLPNVVFVTDIKNKKDARYIKNNRNGILEIAGSETNNITYLVYTMHTKLEIENLADDLGEQIKIFTAKKMIRLLKEKRKAARELKAVKPKASGVNTSLISYNHENDTSKKIELKDLNKNRKRLVIISKKRYIPTKEMALITNWYCNENKLEKDDFETVFSGGMHTVSDLHILEEYGEIYHSPKSDRCGLSKYYKERYSEKMANYNLVLNSNYDKPIKVIPKILTVLFRRNERDIGSEFSSLIFNTRGLIKVLNDNENLNIELKSDGIEDLIQVMKNTPYTYGRTNFSLNDARVTHMLTLIDKKHYSAMSDLSKVLYCGNYSMSITDGTADETPEITNGLPIDIKISESLLKRAYEDNGSSPSKFSKLMINRAKDYVEFVNSVLEGMSTIFE